MTLPASFRVVHAAENIKGGVGTYLRDLVVAQRESFGDGAVVVVVPRSQSDILESPAGVEMITFDDSGPRWRSTLRLAARMRAVMAMGQRSPARADGEVSVVHLHSTFAGLALRPMLRWAAVRRSCAPAVIYCAHGWAFDRETSGTSRQLAITLERALAPACDAIVCISEHEMRLARRAGISPRRLTHIANGIPLHPPAAAISRPEWPDDKRRLLFVGRFDRQKGVDILLEALHELRDSTFAYLVGSAVLGDNDALTLPDNVRVTGWLSGSALTAYYQSADLLVAPSRWEGFGLTAVEAMRAGLPVIAARVGGLTEVVEHGVTGLLVEPNSSRALVEAIRSVGAESLQSMGAAGRQRFAEHFTLDRMHVQLTALYQRVCVQNAAARTGGAGAVRRAQTRSAENG
jgi:glycosyltransferase involved in cell wall biosynthesis